LESSFEITLAKSLLVKLSSGLSQDESFRMMKLLQFYVSSSPVTCESWLDAGLAASLVGPMQLAVGQGIIEPFDLDGVTT
jgi:hypothetical protein